MAFRTNLLGYSSFCCICLSLDRGKRSLGFERPKGSGNIFDRLQNNPLLLVYKLIKSLSGTKMKASDNICRYGRLQFRRNRA